jgi:hypothetical protein
VGGDVDGPGLAMYKALYAFKKTHPTSLSFAENDAFIELPGASGDKNWSATPHLI